MTKKQNIYPNDEIADYMEFQGNQFDRDLPLLQEKYAGQYICFECGRVLGADLDRANLAKKIRETNKKLFFIEKVPERSKSCFEDSCNYSLLRKDDEGVIQKLEKGVTFFVLWLESLGCKTKYSCEGHPYGWYVLFECSYKTAQKIIKILRGCNAGCMMILELSSQKEWAIRLTGFEISEEDKHEILENVAIHIFNSCGFNFQRYLKGNEQGFVLDLS